MPDGSRPFVIDVKRRWTLWILPVLATLYFIGVLLLYVLDYEIEGVSTELLVLVGVGFFILVMLIEIPFLFRRGAPKPPKARPAPARGEPASNGRVDDEYLTTTEAQQGLTVLEYSSPAKSRNTSAVYTKTYVPVSGAHVLRIETAVADAADI